MERCDVTAQNLKDISSELDFGLADHPVPALEELWKAEGCEGGINYRLMVCSPFEKWVEGDAVDNTLASRLLDLVLYYAADGDTAADRPAEIDQTSAALAKEWLAVDPAFQDMTPETKLGVFELATMEHETMCRTLIALTEDKTKPS